MELDPKKQLKSEENLKSTGKDSDPVTNGAPSPATRSKTESKISLKEAINTIKEPDKSKLKEERDKPVSKNTIRSMRTYKEDIAEAVRTQKASLTSVVAAEQERRSGISVDFIKKPATNLKNIGVIFGSTIFILLGIGVVSFFVFFYEKEEVLIKQDISSLIFVEEQKEINITGKNAREILQTIGVERKNVSLPLGQISHLYVTETVQEQEASMTRIISAEEFLTRINAQVSDAFLRSLDTPFMLGIHVFNQNQPFIIFKSNSYQHSFAGLLEWERTIYQDLKLFTGRKNDPVLGAPVNPQTGEEVILRENFEDKIIQNVDVRALLSEAGDIEFLYAFPNQQTLIITTNENTLSEVITRLNSVRIF